MASSDYLPIGADLDLQAARQRAINQATAPDTQPPPPEHPAVTYAKSLLSPMGPYGGYQQGPAASWQIPATLPTPAPAAPSGGFTVPGDYQYPAQPIIGPDLSQIGNDSSNPVGWLKQQLDKIGETPAQYVGPGLFGLGPPQGSQRPTTIGDIGALFAPPTQAQSDNPLFALGPEGNFAGNIAEAAGPLARTLTNKVLGGAQDVLKGRLPEFATQAAGEGRADLGLTGPEKQTNLERMLAQGGDQTKLPARAASDAADAAAGRVPTGGDVSVITGMQAELDGLRARASEINNLPYELRHALNQRELGLERDIKVAQRDQANGFLNRAEATMPPVPEGHTRLYRVEKAAPTFLGGEKYASTQGVSNGRYYSPSDQRSLASGYIQKMGGPDNVVVRYVDVPSSDVERYRVSNLKGTPDEKAYDATPEAARGYEFFVPRDVADTSVVAGGATGGAPRYAVEVGKTRSVIKDTTTGETLPLTFTGKDFGEAAAQAKADALNAPTPSNPFAVPEEASVKAAVTYVTKAKANPVGDTVGTVVRRAARTNPEIVTPEFLASQPDVRAQIDQALTTAKLPPTDENATAVAQQLLAQEKARPSVGNLNTQKVRDALGAPEEPPIDFGPPAAPPTAPPPPPTGGAMPPDVPLPMGPPKATAGGLAMEALRLVTDIPRSLMVIGHLPILRQGLPLMADAIARGNPAEIPLALGRSLQAAVASPLRAAAITQGFRDTVEAAGLKVGRGGVAITDPVGAIAAREEFGLHSALSRVPVISNLNRMYPTMLNSLRTGAAVDLANLYKQSGRAIDSERIGHFVNIVSGRGDIPGALDTPVGREILSGVFFGPRLMTSSWQMAADTIGSLRNVAADVLTRKTLDPVEVAQIRTTAAYVATGVGIMKLANSFGLDIGVDPTKTDFGRITLPDGKRLDLWGPFNENARLIAREIESIQNAVQGKPAYGATTGLDQIVSYFRSHLNAGVPTAVGDVLAGSTQGGESLQQAYGTPEALRSKLLPLPFAGQEAMSGSSMGPGMEALETGLVGAGATVVDQPARVTYDGLGKPTTDPAAGNDPVLQEYGRLMKADPNFAKEPLQPPSTTIGSGRNSIKLPATEEAKYVQAVGEQRRVLLGALIYSQDYQNATVAQQEKMFKDTQAIADRQGNVQYLAHGVIDSTDPKTIAAEAVAGFHSQGGNAKNEAYWVALLDRAGKLTPEVARAIDDSNVSKPGQKAPITVEEYRKAAPLVHEYLGHVPYGTDKSPIGTPADWSAVAQAHIAKNTRVDELVRSGVNPTVADARAQQEILKTMPSTVQRNLFLNGAQLENPLRKLIATKNPTLKRFLGTNPQYTRETDSEYQNFPFGQ